MPHEHGPKSQKPKKDYLQKDEDAYLSEQPKLEAYDYAPGQSLKDKFAVITGGDSGKRISEVGKEPLVFATDIGSEDAVVELADKIAEKFPKVDILVNNAGEQHVHEHLQDITAAEFIRTFQTNVLGMFMLTKALFMSLSQHAAIINTDSITAYAGAPTLIDYSASKGAIVSFTRSLSQNKDVLEKGITYA